MKRLSIGIDPGTRTGIAIWDVPDQKFVYIETVQIHRALRQLFNMRELIKEIIIEDSRVKWYGGSASKQQGAGSIKRDCSIWEDFLNDYEIPHRFVRPRKAITKLDPEQFKLITGYEGRTSEHARDAAMLVFQNESR